MAADHPDLPLSLAEWLADHLRERILDGRLPDGSLLPKQDEIVEEFGVSKPSAREAFRILETEGLITVRRGRVGGSVVHAPRTASVAYMLALVLQSNRVPLADVGFALRQVEPVCAALCASRPDRRRMVMPTLRRAHGRLARAVKDDDAESAVPASRHFHETMVGLCGNETLIAIAGSLEAMWSGHEQDWAGEAVRRKEFPPVGLRRRALEEHQEILELIEGGDAAGAADAARRHLESAQLYPLTGDERRLVSASVMRRPKRPSGL